MWGARRGEQGKGIEGVIVWSRKGGFHQSSLSFSAVRAFILVGFFLKISVSPLQFPKKIISQRYQGFLSGDTHLPELLPL